VLACPPSLTAYSFQCTTYVAGQMTLWLKDEGYSVAQINVYSTGVQGTAIAIGIIATNLVMVYPIWAIFSTIAATLLFCNVCLLVWHIPLGLHCKLPPGAQPRQPTNVITGSYRLLPARVHIRHHTHLVPMGQYDHEGRC
jgi:hypothetical protein